MAASPFGDSVAHSTTRRAARRAEKFSWPGGIRLDFSAAYVICTGNISVGDVHGFCAPDGFLTSKDELADAGRPGTCLDPANGREAWSRRFTSRVTMLARGRRNNPRLTSGAN